MAQRLDYRRKSLKDASTMNKPSWVFKRITRFFADRKFITIAFIHLAITLVIFTHFAMEKFNVQKSKVPAAAPRYDWKIGVPTFEFGTMHAILFQLGALPLTMCRFIISKASSTFLNSIIPFNEMLKCHIAIGYTLVFMLFCTIVVFLMFFGVNCSDGDQAFCDKFTSEIMITGYVIFCLFLTVAVTSYKRTVIPYRVFYILHHIVFLTYALTIFHTLDHIQRTKGGRSQTFKWFTASILLYISDRATMYFNQRYQTTILPESTVVQTGKNKMIILEVLKPQLFYFHPGQYVYLKIPSIDNNWHPFSVSSSPNSKNVVFYIEVFQEKSWTYRLYQKLLTEANGETTYEDNPKTNIGFDGKIEIMGPYGTSLGDVKDYSHALIIGAGTGIVPILSMFQMHFDQLLNLDANRFQKEQAEYHSIVEGLYDEKKNKNRGGSLLGKLLSNCKGETNKPSMWQLKLGAYWHIYQYGLMFIGTILGVIVLGISTSWNLLSFEAYDQMKKILAISTVVFQSAFIVRTVTIQDVASMWFYLDAIFIVLSGLADWNFFSSRLWGRFGSVDMFVFTILTGYMIIRYWITLLKLERNPIESAKKRRNGINILDKVQLVWTTRSPTLISQMLPDFEYIWKTLVDKFGEDFIREVCDITIYCTSRDEAACNDLKDEMIDSALFESGAVRFVRPNFEQIFEQHTTNRMISLSLPASRTLVAFCGSPSLANHVKETKIMNDLSMFVAGVDEHQMDLVVESYGGTKSKEDAITSIENVDHSKLGDLETKDHESEAKDSFRPQRPTMNQSSMMQSTRLMLNEKKSSDMRTSIQAFKGISMSAHVGISEM